MRHYTLLLTLVFFFLPNATYGNELAAFADPENNIAIELDPLLPQPNTPFTARVDDYAVPFQTTGYNWYVDGQELPEARNQRQISLVSKPIGETTRIEVRTRLSTGELIPVTRIVRPLYLDVIFEAQTRTPGFYQGRAVPSVFSQINTIALVHGTTLNSADLMYTWRLNNRVLEGGIVRGKNYISFEMPQGKFAILSVDVSTPNEGSIARRTITLPSTVPVIHFYQFDLLYGQNEKPLLNNSTIVGSTMTIRAEPYFLALETYLDPHHLEWTINNQQIERNFANPYEVILRPTGSSGTARLQLHVRNTVNLLQGARETLVLKF